MNSPAYSFAAVAGLLFTLWSPLTAAVTPAALFSENAVLQRDTRVPIWGVAEPGEKVSVQFGGQNKESAADAAGRWRVELDPMKASSTPAELVIGSDRMQAPIRIPGLLVGEVWVCSGQSNMERNLGPRGGQQPIVNREQEVASANYPGIRHFQVKPTHSDQPLADVSGQWQICSPATAPSFTAVGYYFARDLYKALGIPVGLLHASWGGTPAEAWTSDQVIKEQMPEVPVAHEAAIKKYPAALEKYQADEARLLQEWETAVTAARAEGKTEPRKPAPPNDPQTHQTRPSCLFNAMIHPLIPYAIRGVIWYQGESNAGRAEAYKKLFPLMIGDWRSRWGIGDSPFLFVQIAPHKGMVPEIREAQLFSWKSTPNTSMVVTTDVGDANDIHPTRKEPVGARLALAARALAYGEKIAFSGPVYGSAQFEKGAAVVTFSHADGLVWAGDQPMGFTIAGADGKFYPAKAEIVGKTVRVSAAEVPEPKAVRYGWSNVPECNLVNGAALPASPFRTDAPATVN